MSRSTNIENAMEREIELILQKPSNNITFALSSKQERRLVKEFENGLKFVFIIKEC